MKPDFHLSGSLDQRDRTQAWEQLVDKNTTILVATDLACRGLDSHHADLIIHIDPSKDNANMSHRVGRSGRFGGHGESIQIAINNVDLEKYKDFARFLKYAEIVHTDQQKLVKTINDRLESGHKIKEQEMEHFKGPQETIETEAIQFETPQIEIEKAESLEKGLNGLLNVGSSGDAIILKIGEENENEREDEDNGDVPMIEESKPHDAADQTLSEEMSSSEAVKFSPISKPGPIRKPVKKRLDFQTPFSRGARNRSAENRIPPIWETLGVPRPRVENSAEADTEKLLDSIDKMTDEEFKEWRRTVKPRGEKEWEKEDYDEDEVETIDSSETDISSGEDYEREEEEVVEEKIPEKLMPKAIQDDFDFGIIQRESEASENSEISDFESEESNSCSDEDDEVEEHESRSNLIPFVDRYAALKSRWLAYHRSSRSFTA